VEWLVDPEAPEHAEAVRKAVREIEFYLAESRERNPWAYTKYHSGTSSNWYSALHWSFLPDGPGPEGPDGAGAGDGARDDGPIAT
jgi:hypothetical protein